jgi:hypothetical protein
MLKAFVDSKKDDKWWKTWKRFITN